jgi:hypothetical protein
MYLLSQILASHAKKYLEETKDTEGATNHHI